MTRIGRRRKAKKYDYNKNRRKAYRKQKKRTVVHEETMKKVWDDQKSINYNMEAMGLCIDPNKAVSKGKGTRPDATQSAPVPDKSDVRKELEEKAALPERFRLKMSEPDTQYVVYMLDKYGEDYKAMAKDRRNYYQDTPKQIKKKIESFKKVPGMYDCYLLMKEQTEATSSS